MRIEPPRPYLPLPKRHEPEPPARVPRVPGVDRLLLHGSYVLGFGLLVASYISSGPVIGVAAYAVFLVWSVACVRLPRIGVGAIAETVTTLVACVISTSVLGRSLPEDLSPSDANVIAAFCHAVTLAVLVLPLWRDRHPRTPATTSERHCEKCGYNLTGNVSGVCPECGTPVADERGKA
jgi:hypothetical protein